MNIKKLGRSIKKGIVGGLKGVNKAGRTVIKAVGKETGKWDRATGGVLGDVFENVVPGGKQLMQAYDMSKKGLKTSEGLQGALEGKRSYKSVLRDTDLIPSKYKDEVLMGYDQSAKEFSRQKNINRGAIKDMAIDRGRAYTDLFKQGQGNTKDRLNMIRPAVQGDINQALQNLKIRNPILSGRLNQMMGRA